MSPIDQNNTGNQGTESLDERISGAIESVNQSIDGIVDKFLESIGLKQFLARFGIGIDDVESGTSSDSRSQIEQLAISLDPSVIPPFDSVRKYGAAADVPHNSWCRLEYEGEDTLFYCVPSSSSPGMVMVPADTMSFITGSMGYRPGQTATNLEEFIQSRLVSVDLPSTFTGDVDSIRVSPFIRDSLNQAFRQMEREGVRYHVHSAGCFCFRGVRGLGRQSRADYVPRMSNHSLGMAIDFNPGSNEYRAGATTDMPPRMISILKEHGFEWGGDWSTPDMMHFQKTPDDLQLNVA